MAITTLLTIGPAHELLADVVYALPARACVMTATGAGTIETSSLIDSGFGAATLTDNQSFLSASFIRSVGGISTVTLRQVSQNPFP